MDPPNKDAHKIQEHSEEAERRSVLAHRDALYEAKRSLHRKADEAWKVGDVIEHRIFCMAANIIAGHIQKFPPLVK